VLGARRKDRIDALVRDITGKGGNALGFKTDVTRRGDLEALVRGAVDKHGRIDVIVNNSGIMPIAPMAALKIEEWDRMIDVNIKGLLYGVAAILPIMQKQKLGHIINIASVAGFKVWAPGGTVYSATKFAVRALTEGLRMEHRADNIRCTIVSPGAVATELPESSSEEATRKNLREFYRMAISADSIARAISYAIEQPADVEIGEIVIRPTAQEF
jgi:NADP-dependent 3-hydroxy acid dehydrogenase YdfG